MAIVYCYITQPAIWSTLLIMVDSYISHTVNWSILVDSYISYLAKWSILVVMLDCYITYLAT